MAKGRTVLQAGKQIAKIVGERAVKGKAPKERPEDVLKDPAAQTQGAAKRQATAEAEGAQEPGNPNEIGYDDGHPGQQPNDSMQTKC